MQIWTLVQPKHLSLLPADPVAAARESLKAQGQRTATNLNNGSCTRNKEIPTLDVVKENLPTTRTYSSRPENENARKLPSPIMFSVRAGSASWEKPSTQLGVHIHTGISWDNPCATQIWFIKENHCIHVALTSLYFPSKIFPHPPAWPKSPKGMVEIPHMVLSRYSWSQYLHGKMCTQYLPMKKESGTLAT